MLSRIQILSSLILAQVWLSTSHFVFDLEVDLGSVTAVDCRMGLLETSECRVYFSVFCLREERGDPQSTDENDCPLGRNTERLNTYLENQPNTIGRRITSHGQWPVSFQLYIKARDNDTGITSDDDLDDIFIGHTLQLEANTGFTEMKKFTGILNRVNFRARFRVTCQQNYYGAHCDTHCVPQNDDTNGHYKCNSDGSIRCLEGFENPNNNCRDRTDPCSSSPCANNSSCIPMGPFDYTCPQCAAGYTGPRCEVNIDDCQSALCPNNSTSNFTTEAASENKTMPTTTMKLIILHYGVAAAGAVALIVIAIIIFTVVLAVIMIKWKRKRIHCSHQEREQLDNLSLKIHTEDNQAYGQFSSLIKFNVEDNPAYGQFTHHMKHPQER